MHEKQFLIRTLGGLYPARSIPDRIFKPKVKNSFSTNKTVATGVLQGSILGPILYIFYNNDMPKHRKTKLAIFADDTATYSQLVEISQAVKNVKEHAEELLRKLKN